MALALIECSIPFVEIRWCYEHLISAVGVLEMVRWDAFLLLGGVKYHDDVMTQKCFPYYWPYVRGIHRSQVDFPNKWQVCVFFVVSMKTRWNNSWVIGNLWCYEACVTWPQCHYTLDMVPLSAEQEKIDLLNERLEAAGAEKVDTVDPLDGPSTFKHIKKCECIMIISLITADRVENYAGIVSMVWGKTVLTRLLTCWSYCSLVLSHQYL